MTVADTAQTLTSEPFGPDFGAGPVNDRLALSGTPLSSVATDNVKIGTFREPQYGQFTIAEIVIFGHLAPTVETLLRSLQIEVDGAGPGQALYDKMTHALNKWAAGQSIPACNAVADFSALVAVHTGKSIDIDVAADWIARATQAADLMAC